MLDTEAVSARPGSEYNAPLSFDGDRGLESLTASFTVQEPAVWFDRPLPAARTQIRGGTIYENGSTVTLGIWARGGDIRQSRTVQVDRDGGFTAPVDVQALAGESIHVRLESVGDWRKIPVRDGAEVATTTTTTTTTTTAAAVETTAVTASTTRQTTTPARETTTTARTTPTARNASTTPTAAATAGVGGGERALTATTTGGVSDPDAGLLSGLWSTVGWGVVAVGGALVAANRIAD